MTEEIKLSAQYVLSEKEISILQKIEKLLDEDKDVHIFTFDEVDTIKEMMSVYQAIVSFGKVGNFLKNIAIGLVATYIAYLTLWGHLSEISKFFIKFLTST